jgi:heme exporter protein A
MTLQVVDLACVRGHNELFTGLNFTLTAGEAMRVAGTNGAGKTSLLRMLAGLAFPAQGTVLWNAKAIQAQREDFGRSLIYLGHAASIKDDLSAWENLIFSAALSAQKITQDQAYQALDTMGIAHAADLPVRMLSQGQRKRVALARLHLAGDSKLWILDEPFNALDQASVQQLCACMEAHLGRGGMLIYTTHQEIQLRAQAQHTLDLNQRVIC